MFFYSPHPPGRLFNCLRVSSHVQILVGQARREKRDRKGKFQKVGIGSTAQWCNQNPLPFFPSLPLISLKHIHTMPPQPTYQHQHLQQFAQMIAVQLLLCHKGPCIARTVVWIVALSVSSTIIHKLDPVPILLTIV